MKTKIFYLLTILLLGLSAFAQKDCYPKKPQALVYDEVGVLNQNQIETLNQKLIQFDKSTSTQIVVVIVNDLCGMDEAMYATELGHKWGVGQADKDNGIIMLIMPNGGQGQRKTYIAVGYGLEDVIPDAIAKRIVSNELIPNFKQGNIYGGIDAGTNVIMEIAVGKYSAKEYEERSGSIPPRFYFLLFIILFIFIIPRIVAARKYGKSNNLGLWAALLLLSSTSHSHSGHYNSFRSGSGGFGRSGGGFGGFGGGGFGGGGAGGSW